MFTALMLVVSGLAAIGLFSVLGIILVGNPDWDVEEGDWSEPVETETGKELKELVEQPHRAAPV